MTLSDAEDDQPSESHAGQTDRQTGSSEQQLSSDGDSDNHAAQAIQNRPTENPLSQQAVVSNQESNPQVISGINETANIKVPTVENGALTHDDNPISLTLPIGDESESSSAPPRSASEQVMDAAQAVIQEAEQDTSKSLSSERILQKLQQIQSYIHQTTSAMESLEQEGDITKIKQYNTLAKVVRELKSTQVKLISHLTKLKEKSDEEKSVDVQEVPKNESSPIKSGSEMVGVVACMEGDMPLPTMREELERHNTEQEQLASRLRDSLTRRQNLMARYRNTRERLNALKNQRTNLAQEERRILQAEGANENPYDDPVPGAETWSLEQLQSSQHDFRLLGDKVRHLEAAYRAKKQATPAAETETIADVDRKLEQLGDKQMQINLALRQLADLEKIKIEETRGDDSPLDLGSQISNEPINLPNPNNPVPNLDAIPTPPSSNISLNTNIDPNPLTTVERSQNNAVPMQTSENDIPRDSELEARKEYLAALETQLSTMKNLLQQAKDRRNASGNSDDIEITDADSSSSSHESLGLLPPSAMLSESTIVGVSGGVINLTETERRDPAIIQKYKQLNDAKSRLSKMETVMATIAQASQEGRRLEDVLSPISLQLLHEARAEYGNDDAEGAIDVSQRDRTSTDDSGISLNLQTSGELSSAKAKLSQMEDLLCLITEAAASGQQLEDVLTKEQIDMIEGTTENPNEGENNSEPLQHVQNVNIPASNIGFRPIEPGSSGGNKFPKCGPNSSGAVAQVSTSSAVGASTNWSSEVQQEFQKAASEISNVNSGSQNKEINSERLKTLAKYDYNPHLVEVAKLQEELSAKKVALESLMQQLGKGESDVDLSSGNVDVELQSPEVDSNFSLSNSRSRDRYQSEDDLVDVSCSNPMSLLCSSQLHQAQQRADSMPPLQKNQNRIDNSNQTVNNLSVRPKQNEIRGRSIPSTRWEVQSLGVGSSHVPPPKSPNATAEVHNTVSSALLQLNQVQESINTLCENLKQGKMLDSYSSAFNSNINANMNTIPVNNVDHVNQASNRNMHNANNIYTNQLNPNVNANPNVNLTTCNEFLPSNMNSLLNINPQQPMLNNMTSISNLTGAYEPVNPLQAYGIASSSPQQIAPSNSQQMLNAQASPQNPLLQGLQQCFSQLQLQSMEIQALSKGMQKLDQRRSISQSQRREDRRNTYLTPRLNDLPRYYREDGGVPFVKPHIHSHQQQPRDYSKNQNFDFAPHIHQSRSVNDCQRDFWSVEPQCPYEVPWESAGNLGNISIPPHDESVSNPLYDCVSPLAWVEDPHDDGDLAHGNQNFFPPFDGEDDTETKTQGMSGYNVDAEMNGHPWINGHFYHNNSSDILNNQVLPGSRTNNYWDNFRSYSRQNPLTNSKRNTTNVAQRPLMNKSQIQRSIHNSRWQNHPSSLNGNRQFNATSAPINFVNRASEKNRYRSSNKGSSRGRYQKTVPQYSKSVEAVRSNRGSRRGSHRERQFQESSSLFKADNIDSSSASHTGTPVNISGVQVSTSVANPVQQECSGAIASNLFSEVPSDVSNSDANQFMMQIVQYASKLTTHTDRTVALELIKEMTSHPTSLGASGGGSGHQNSSLDGEAFSIGENEGLWSPGRASAMYRNTNRPSFKEMKIPSGSSSVRDVENRHWEDSSSASSTEEEYFKATRGRMKNAKRLLHGSESLHSDHSSPRNQTISDVGQIEPSPNPLTFTDSQFLSWKEQGQVQNQPVTVPQNRDLRTKGQNSKPHFPVEREGPYNKRTSLVMDMNPNYPYPNNLADKLHSNLFERKIYSAENDLRWEYRPTPKPKETKQKNLNLNHSELLSPIDSNASLDAPLNSSLKDVPAANQQRVAIANSLDGFECFLSAILRETFQILDNEQSLNFNPEVFNRINREVVRQLRRNCSSIQLLANFESIQTIEMELNRMFAQFQGHSIQARKSEVSTVITQVLISHRDQLKNLRSTKASTLVTQPQTPNVSGGLPIQDKLGPNSKSQKLSGTFLNPQPNPNNICQMYQNQARFPDGTELPNDSSKQSPSLRLKTNATLFQNFSQPKTKYPYKTPTEKNCSVSSNCSEGNLSRMSFSESRHHPSNREQNREIHANIKVPSNLFNPRVTNVPVSSQSNLKNALNFSKSSLGAVSKVTNKAPLFNSLPSDSINSEYIQLEGMANDNNKRYMDPSLPLQGESHIPNIEDIEEPQVTVEPLNKQRLRSNAISDRLRENPKSLGTNSSNHEPNLGSVALSVRPRVPIYLNPPVRGNSSSLEGAEQKDAEADQRVEHSSASNGLMLHDLAEADQSHDAIDAECFDSSVEDDAIQAVQNIPQKSSNSNMNAIGATSENGLDQIPSRLLSALSDSSLASGPTLVSSRVEAEAQFTSPMFSPRDINNQPESLQDCPEVEMSSRHMTEE